MPKSIRARTQPFKIAAERCRGCPGAPNSGHVTDPSACKPLRTIISGAGILSTNSGHAARLGSAVKLSIGGATQHMVFELVVFRIYWNSLNISLCEPQVCNIFSMKRLCSNSTRCTRIKLRRAFFSSSGGGMARAGLGLSWRCLLLNDFRRKKPVAINEIGEQNPWLSRMSPIERYPTLLETQISRGHRSHVRIFLSPVNSAGWQEGGRALLVLLESHTPPNRANRDPGL